MPIKVFVVDDSACGFRVLEGGCFFEGGGDVVGVGNSYHVRIGVGLVHRAGMKLETLRPL